MNMTCKCGSVKYYYNWIMLANWPKKNSNGEIDHILQKMSKKNGKTK